MESSLILVLNDPIGLGPWHLLWAGGRCLFGSVFWGAPCCETGLLLLGWDGPREHERVWWVPCLAVSTVPFVFLFFFAVFPYTMCAFHYYSRNRGSARCGHIWPGVQSVEKQRVRVPELQKIDSSFPLRPTLGEMSRHGPQQQPHRQPQVSQWRSFVCWIDTKRVGWDCLNVFFFNRLTG